MSTCMCLPGDEFHAPTVDSNCSQHGERKVAPSYIDVLIANAALRRQQLDDYKVNNEDPYSVELYAKLQKEHEKVLAKIKFAILDDLQVLFAWREEIKTEWQNKVSVALHKLVSRQLTAQEAKEDQEGSWSGDISLNWPDTEVLRELAEKE